MAKREAVHRHLERPPDLGLVRALQPWLRKAHALDQQRRVVAIDGEELAPRPLVDLARC
jgi:hypothetical protein